MANSKFWFLRGERRKTVRTNSPWIPHNRRLTGPDVQIGRFFLHRIAATGHRWCIVASLRVLFRVFQVFSGVQDIW